MHKKSEVPLLELAVVIPAFITTHDHLRYTAETVASVQSRYPCRTLLVLNRWQGFEAELDALASDHSLTMIRNPEPQSVAASWNYGISWGLRNGAAAVLVLNNDIVCKANCIDRLVDFSRVHPEFTLVTAWDHPDLGNLEEAEEREEWVEHPRFSCFLAGQKLVERVGWFDESFYPAYFEDNDMHRRILLAGERAVCYLGARFFHHGSRTVNADPNLAALNVPFFERNRDYYLAKWGGLPGCERFDHSFDNRGDQRSHSTMTPYTAPSTASPG